MNYQYLHELADIADPDKLWRLAGFDQLDLPPDKRRQLDTGVALRRYAEHLDTLAHALAMRRSVLITPLSENSTALMSCVTPIHHRQLRAQRGPRK